MVERREEWRGGGKGGVGGADMGEEGGWMTDAGSISGWQKVFLTCTMLPQHVTAKVQEYHTLSTHPPLSSPNLALRAPLLPPPPTHTPVPLCVPRPAWQPA